MDEKNNFISTKEERSLLLYFETCMVDDSGRVDTRRMNGDDIRIAKKWTELGFIIFYRLPFNVIEKLKWKYSYQLEFSDKAWELAHKERKERSKRMIKKAIENGTKNKIIKKSDPK